MLLTSSQVSVAISSFIVFFFTLALFLSGYVLQQQTVRDLRAAIKPQIVRPQPELQLYLPPQFREHDEELPGDASDLVPDLKRDVVNGDSRGNDGEDDEDMVGATRWQKAKRRKEREARQKALNGEGGEESPGNPASGQQGREGVEIQPKKEEKPLSRAERRKRIKEQILAEGDGESFKGYRRRAW
ncbi:hypothetical protein BGZ60DRAFT_566471 [Tricladium varicosporioides]|nr:hypothetical protein BGZ60DRAFT_566471 [Hymenoscyphus varicosporioides]